MWELPKLEQRTADFDFTSAGMGHRSVHQLLADSIVFANAVELTDWEQENAQVIVCESCGVTHCQPGGWLAPRRAGEFVVFGPDSRLFTENASDRNEYRPPDYAKRFGWPFTTLADYESLRRLATGLPSIERLNALSRRDVAAISQWEAPASVLGRAFERPLVRRDLILACSTGDIDGVIATLSDTALQWATDNAPVVLERSEAASEIFLDVPNARVWRPLARVDGGWGLFLEPGLVARDCA